VVVWATRYGEFVIRWSQQFRLQRMTVFPQRGTPTLLKNLHLSAKSSMDSMTLDDRRRLSAILVGHWRDPRARYERIPMAMRAVRVWMRTRSQLIKTLRQAIRAFLVGRNRRPNSANRSLQGNSRSNQAAKLSSAASSPSRAASCTPIGSPSLDCANGRETAG
jgi:hypothetical protein